jgi:hypothetical protein
VIELCLNALFVKIHQKSQCSLCSWNLTVYSLTPNGLKQERKNRLEWSKRIWKELQALKEAIDDLRDEYQYLIEQEQESVDELQEFLESDYREVDEWLRNCAIDAAIKEGWFNE